MTDPQDVDDLDRTARVAARGLRDHVERNLDLEHGLARIPIDAPVDRRGRLLVAAAVAILVLGGLAIAGAHGPGVGIDDHQRQLPPPEALSPLGPTDGKDSMGLAVEVEPATGLQDEQRVHARGEGFDPGESIGIVQCAREAGPASAGGSNRGVDACELGSYTPVTAAADGTASGTYAVKRFLTTGLTGTIDCASEPDRCLVAMGAISDYDRSGGQAVAFVEGEPGDGPEIPTIEVAPATGLHDRDRVRVTGEGYQPDSVVLLQVCAADPTACWSTGETTEEQGVIGLDVDGQGRIDGEVPVWRYLPTGQPGRYVDCAVSSCALRVQGTNQSTSPPPAPLGFQAGGKPPTAAAFGVNPDRGLQAGDSVDLIADGLAPGSHVAFMFCVVPGASGLADQDSVSAFFGDREVGDDGSVVTRAELPDPASLAQDCAGCATATTTFPRPAAGGTLCDGVTTHCTIGIEPGMAATVVAPPFFLPSPVPVRFGGT